MKNASLLNASKQINELETSLTVPIKDEVKKQEIRFAVTIAMHRAFLTGDYLGDLLISENAFVRIHTFCLFNGKCCNTSDITDNYV